MPRFFPLALLRRETGAPVGAAIARAVAQPSLLIILLLSVAGAAHILLRTATYGAGLTEDSTSLWSAALNLLAGEGLQHSRGAPLTAYAPLFPLLLAFIGWFGGEPVEAGRWVNGLAFGLVILTAGLWLRANLRSSVVAVAATGLLAVAVDFNHHFATLMTEPLFILFTLLGLMQLAAYRRVGVEERRWRPLLLAAVCTGLAAVTRYPGVALIVAGVLLLLLPGRGGTKAARIWAAFLFGAIAALPLAAALGRNWLVSGTFTGPRRVSVGDTLTESLGKAGEVFGQWLLPIAGPDWLTYGLLAGAAGLIAATGGILLSGRRRNGEGMAGGWGAVVPFAVFVPLYLVFMIAFLPAFSAGGIDSRYLLPAYAPLLLLAAFLVDRALAVPAADKRAAARRVVMGVILLGVLVHGAAAVGVNVERTRAGWEFGYIDRLYNTAYWQGLATTAYLRDNLPGVKAYSNNPYLLWAQQPTASPGQYQSLDYSLAAAAESLAADTEGRVVVWLKREGIRGHLYGYNEFDARALPGIQVIADLTDGVILRYPPGRFFDAAEFGASRADYFEGLKAAAGERVAQGGGFELYRNGQRLTYYRERCTAGDTAARFFLHIDAVAAGDLPGWTRRHGYENRDFDFRRRGLLVAGQCIAVVELPDYPISRIRTGQFKLGSGRIWEVALPP